MTVLLTAGAAMLMSGCDSFKFCHHHAHGDPPTSNILIGFVCIGYHDPNTVHPDFTIKSGASAQQVSSVQSGDLVLFSAAISQTIPNEDGLDAITSLQWDLEGDGDFVSASTTPDGGPVYDVSHQYVTTVARQVTITLRATDELGSTSEISHVLTVLPRGSPPSPSDPPPTAAFTASPNPAMPEQSVQFDASGSSDPAGQITDYKWDFGDGSAVLDSGTNPIASHAYYCSGMPTAALTVTDESGQTATTTRMLSVESGFPPCPAAANMVRAARASPGRLFQAKFAGSRVVRVGALTRRGTVATVRGLLVAGRLRGKLLGSRALSRFGNARFTATFTLRANVATHLTTIRAVALATFAGAPGTSACLEITARRRGRGLPVGSFHVLGGTGASAHLSGGGTFLYALSGANGRIAGRLHISSRRAHGLPAACLRLDTVLRAHPLSQRLGRVGRSDPSTGTLIFPANPSTGFPQGFRRAAKG